MSVLTNNKISRKRRETMKKMMFVMLVNLCACAGTLAEKGPLVEIGQPITTSALVQIGQMGLDCNSQETSIILIVRDMIKQKGAPQPKHIEIKMLAGSSLCGLAQGAANELGTPELGARNLARAEITLYWSNITESELELAKQALDLMRAAPFPPAK
jgi:hypothetical protein